MIKLRISIGIGMSLVKSKCQSKVTVLVNYVKVFLQAVE
jgi:hypothetical protein